MRARERARGAEGLARDACRMDRATQEGEGTWWVLEGEKKGYRLQ